MAKIAVVYHSGYGHTEVVARHVVQGALSVSGVTAQIFKVDDVMHEPDKLNDFDAIIFGSPTYMGSVSAPFKAFMDATAGIWFKQAWKDKLAAGFTNSGGLSGDKFNSLVQLVTFAAQHSMLWVSLGLMNESIAQGKLNGDPTCENRLGAFLGAMAQSDNLPPTQTPPAGDLKTAQLLGERVAKAAVRWNI